PPPSMNQSHSSGPIGATSILTRGGVYAGIMAHGTSLTAVECARMIPQLSATSIRQAMRWARDERRLSQAC
ncbi:Tn3 family transposase, partial [Enterobacter hormaechei]|uniref:Tn3 family transposase n=1 Tax=Enterobacter hormaechei TaxID=158836 RepID=UPI001EF97551